MMKKKKSFWLSFAFALALLASVVASATAASFNDVEDNFWGKEAIDYVTEKGIFNGVDATSFDPQGALTRGQFVTVLGRLAQAPATGTPAFTDVPANAYYAPYVAWAAEKAIVKGTGPATFAPDDPITREQMAVMLVAFAEVMNIDLGEPQAAAPVLNDQSKVSAWAKDAVAKAVQYGLMTGDENGSFDPQGNATRAQSATVLYRFHQSYGSQIKAEQSTGGIKPEVKEEPKKEQQLSHHSPTVSKGNPLVVPISNMVVDSFLDGEQSRHDVKTTVEGWEKNGVYTYNITLEPATPGGAINPQRKLDDKFASPLYRPGIMADGLPVAAGKADGGNVLNGDFTVFSMSFLYNMMYNVLLQSGNPEEPIPDGWESNPPITIIQTNNALQMYSTDEAVGLGKEGDPLIEKQGGQWVKTDNTLKLMDITVPTPNVSFIVPSKEVAPKITLELQIDGKRTVMFQITNKLTFDQKAAVPEPEDEEALTKSFSTPLGAATIDFSCGSIVEQENETLYLNYDINNLVSNCNSVLYSLVPSKQKGVEKGLDNNGYPLIDNAFAGKFSFGSLNLNQISPIQNAASVTFTIVQENPALEVYQADPDVKKNGGVWSKVSTLRAEDIKKEGDYNFPICHKGPAKITVKDSGNHVLAVINVTCNTKLTREIEWNLQLSRALERLPEDLAGQDNATLTLSDSYYPLNALLAPGKTTIQCSRPITIKGNPKKELTYGVAICSDNVTLQNVNVAITKIRNAIMIDYSSVNGIYARKLDEGLDPAQKGGAVSGLTLQNCNVTMNYKFTGLPTATNGIHIFGATGEGNLGTNNKIINCKVDVSGVTYTNKKTIGIQIGSPDATVSDCTITGATHGMVISTLGENHGFTLSNNKIALREDIPAPPLTKAEYVIWYDGMPEETVDKYINAGFGTAAADTEGRVPENVTAWLQGLKGDNTVLIGIGDKKEQWVKADSTLVKYFWDGENWTAYNPAPPVEQPQPSVVPEPAAGPEEQTKPEEQPAEKPAEQSAQQPAEEPKKEVGQQPNSEAGGTKVPQPEDQPINQLAQEPAA